jgi:site-specific DNA-methyltransferase (adenine-specific)
MTSETYNMDCMEYMRGLHDKSFELAIVDVPYGIKQGGEKNSTRSRLVTQKNGSKRLVTAKTYHSFDDDKSPDKKYFDELLRVSKNQIIWGANHFISKIPYDSPCWIVWDKVNGSNDFADCELAWTSFNSAVRKFTFMWNGMFQGSPSNGSIHNGNMSKNEQRIHPCQKPVALYKWLLNHYAHAGDRILDTHLGSGSSRIAAYDMGFDFVGIELDKDYFEAEEKRFNEHCAQGELFSMNGGKPVDVIQPELSEETT